MANARDRAAFTAGLGTQAWAVRIGDEWFAGFGGKDVRIVKFRRHLADAMLMVSTQRAADYARRLAERGHPGASIVAISVTGSAS